MIVLYCFGLDEEYNPGWRHCGRPLRPWIMLKVQERMFFDRPFTWSKSRLVASKGDMFPMPKQLRGLDRQHARFGGLAGVGSIKKKRILQPRRVDLKE